VATIEKPVVERRFEHLVLDFLAYLEFERGLSRNTLDAYRSDLLQFGRFLEEREQSALEASPADVSDFLERLATGGDFSRRSIQIFRMVLRAALDDAVATGELRRSPAARVGCPDRS